MSIPLHIHLATTTLYPESQNAALTTIITLGIYTVAIFASSLIVLYIYCHSTTLPLFPCHTSQPFLLMNLSTCPCLTLSLSGSISSQHPRFTPSTSLSLPPPPFSLQSKDCPATKQMSPANSLFNFSTTLHLHKSSTLELAWMTYLTFLASHFALPSPSCLDWSPSCFTPTPSIITWRSSLVMSSTQPSTKSTSPSLKLNSSTTKDRLGLFNSLLTLSHPFPWPFESPHVPLSLCPPS